MFEMKRTLVPERRTNPGYPMMIQGYQMKNPGYLMMSQGCLMKVLVYPTMRGLGREPIQEHQTMTQIQKAG